MNSESGFTLLELIIATAISALVLGILAVCLSFTIREWEVSANLQPDQSFLLTDLLKRQLAESDPTPIKFTDGSVRSLFSAHSNSLTFITSHSVKAISQGVPVVARYDYNPGSKMLSYSELLLNPYYPKAIEEFMAGGSPGEKKMEIASYGTYFSDFQMAYSGRGAKEFSQSWEGSDKLPLEILVVWRGTDPVVHTMRCMVNAPFEKEAIREQEAQAAGTGGLNPLDSPQ